MYCKKAHNKRYYRLACDVLDAVIGSGLAQSEIPKTVQIEGPTCPDVLLQGVFRAPSPHG